MRSADKQLQMFPEPQGEGQLSRKTEWARLKAMRERFASSHFPQPIASWFTNPEGIEHQPARCVCAVICINIERFELYRGSLGYAGADRILDAIRERMSSSLCLANAVGGIAYVEIGSCGGGKFTVFVAGVSGPVEAAAVAEQLQKVIAEPLQVLDHTVYLATSAGVAAQKDGAENSAKDEDLFADAESAMFAARSEGPQLCQAFDPSMRLDAIRRLDLERDLHTALSRNELHVVYQPIMRLKSGSVEGFEALVRWDHPVLGTISPADFIPIAEETGLIVGIGQFVMAEACREACRLDRELAPTSGGKPLSMSVNVSKCQLTQPGLVQFMRTVLAQTQLQPNRLQLEITESIVMDDAESVSPMLTELRNLGVRIAMDDFGVGHSSMHCLLQFPLDCLKIDKALTERLTTTDRHIAAVAALVSLARNLGIQLVAEGIETTEQAVALRDMDCDLMQGFLLSKPLKPEPLREFLRRNGWSLNPIAQAKAA